MDTFVIAGGRPLEGNIMVAGAKNVALKACAAALLTRERVVIKNVPDIRDIHLMLEVLKSLGVEVELANNILTIEADNLTSHQVPLELGARLRTSSMVLGPLLSRMGQAKIPNPGGCRIGARPIDRHIEGLRAMGARITYHPEDGYFYAEANKLTGVEVEFAKNTHTGTETLLLAAVLSEGETVLKNAAAEIEVDDLISLLKAMGANIKRNGPREIIIKGVAKLHGVEYAIMPDRNEEVTWAIAAAATAGNITVSDSRLEYLESFLPVFIKAGGGFERIDNKTTRYFRQKDLVALDVTTGVHPQFMTDWQAPWAVLMTQAVGKSVIHETVFESRFSYVSQLRKMGAAIEFFDPKVTSPAQFYNFNWDDHEPGSHQAISISGPTKLHNAIVNIDDLRAGATLVIAAIIASGESFVHGAEQVDRGYENIEARLTKLGANIRRIKEE